MVPKEICGPRCPEAPKHIDLQLHTSLVAIALMGTAQSIQDGSAAPLITAASRLARAALAHRHGLLGRCRGRSPRCVLEDGVHQRGSSHHADVRVVVGAGTGNEPPCTPTAHQNTGSETGSLCYVTAVTHPIISLQR